MTDIEELRARMREAAEKAEQVAGGEWKPNHVYSGVVGVNAKIGGEANLFDVRGWGYLTGLGHGGLGLSSEEARQHQRALAEHAALASPANVKALDAYTTRLREDLDRVTRERDAARAEYREAISDRHVADANEKKMYGQWRDAERRAEAAEAALAKRDEEVARLREALQMIRDRAFPDQPDSVDDETVWAWQQHDVLQAIARKALTQEPTNA